MENNILSGAEYAEEVFYCSDCHSLHVLTDSALATEEWDGTYCGKCNSANIATCTLGEWLAEEAVMEQKRKEIEWNR